MHNKLPIVLAVVLTASILLISSSVYAADSTSSATVLNAAPAVGVGLTPDDDPAAGVQVINPNWQTLNKTVTIRATVTDMNGWDDLTGIVTAVITGPSPVNDSPVNLTFDYEINVTTVVYTGVFNVSTHAEGDYTVNVTADDAGGLSDSGQENFTYFHTAGDVAIYDFTTGTGKDKWAFRKQHSDKPPADNDDPNNEFKPEEYEPIKVDDGMMQEDASAAKKFYAIHRFNFSIAEPEDAITRIDILWDGKGEHDWGIDGATLYVWNFGTGAYEQLDSTTTDDPITLEGSVTTTIDDYLGPDSNLIFIAEQNTAQWKLFRWSYHSRLSTDYVKVEVTYTPQPDVVVLNVTPSAAAVHPGDGMTFAVDVRNDGAPAYGYVGGAARYPNGTYCNTEWEMTGYLNTGDTATVYLDWTVPADAPPGQYGFVSATWDGCWTGCEGTPCYLDGCCDGMQDSHEADDVFEVVT